MKVLKSIIKDIGVKKIVGNLDKGILGISTDSRKVKDGHLFIAIKGINSDGNEFVDEAARDGALCIVSEKSYAKNPNEDVTYIQVEDARKAAGRIAANWFNNPSEKLKVIGVTGTKGKSTTAYILHKILEASGYKVGSVTSIEAKIGDEKYETGLHVTNPDVITLNKFLKKMVDKNCEYAVLEVTSHGLDQQRTAGIEFYAGILTNIKHEHLDYHKTFENYQAAKAKLFENIEIAILNKDDVNSFNYIAKKLRGNTSLITYSSTTDADYFISNVKSQEDMSFSIIDDGAEHKLTTNIIGDFNAMNFAAAIAFARNEDISWDNISSAVKNITPPTGRMEIIPNEIGLNIYLDFAHTPDSLEKVLMFLNKKHPESRIISVFGCASERDTQKRPMMGRISADLANISIFTAEDPRKEDINKILDEIEKGVDGNAIFIKQGSKVSASKKHYYLKIPERGEAIHFAINKAAQKGDVVVICGKGHEKSMAYNGIEYPWSDTKAIKLALKNKVLEIER